MKLNGDDLEEKKWIHESRFGIEWSLRAHSNVYEKNGYEYLAAHVYVKPLVKTAAKNNHRLNEFFYPASSSHCADFLEASLYVKYALSIKNRKFPDRNFTSGFFISFMMLRYKFSYLN